VGRIGTQAGPTKVEAVTQASSGSDLSIAIPFDNTNGYLSSVAVANTGGVASTVTFTATDESGAILATNQLSLGINAVTGIVLRNSYPALNGHRGLLIFTGTGGLSGIGFLFNPTGSFSTEPVTALY
jgi:hypothetical protein